MCSLWSRDAHFDLEIIRKNVIFCKSQIALGQTRQQGRDLSPMSHVQRVVPHLVCMSTNQDVMDNLAIEIQLQSVPYCISPISLIELQLCSNSSCAVLTDTSILVHFLMS